MAHHVSKPGYGQMFTNKRRSSDKSPDFNGQFISPTDKKLYYIAGWIRDNDKGKFMNIVVTDPTVSYSKDQIEPLIKEEDGNS